jgi:hypothetical protein
MNKIGVIRRLRVDQARTAHLRDESHERGPNLEPRELSPQTEMAAMSETEVPQRLSVAVDVEPLRFAVA